MTGKFIKAQTPPRTPCRRLAFLLAIPLTIIYLFFLSWAFVHAYIEVQDNKLYLSKNPQVSLEEQFKSAYETTCGNLFWALEDEERRYSLKSRCFYDKTFCFDLGKSCQDLRKEFDKMNGRVATPVDLAWWQYFLHETSWARFKVLDIEFIGINLFVLSIPLLICWLFIFGKLEFISVFFMRFFNYVKTGDFKIKEKKQQERQCLEFEERLVNQGDLGQGNSRVNSNNQAKSYDDTMKKVLMKIGKFLLKLMGGCLFGFASLFLVSIFTLGLGGTYIHAGGLLAIAGGFVLGWKLVRRFTDKNPEMTENHFGDASNTGDKIS